MSKAFDMVSYNKLWSKLSKTNVAPVLIMILKYWYSHKINYVRWATTM